MADVTALQVARRAVRPPRGEWSSKREIWGRVERERERWIEVRVVEGVGGGVLRGAGWRGGGWGGGGGGGVVKGKWGGGGGGGGRVGWRWGWWGGWGGCGGVWWCRIWDWMGVGGGRRW